MSRILCCVLPEFPLQAAIRAHPELHDLPVVIGGIPSDPHPVVACSAQAAEAGIRPGMRLKEAQACCPEAIFLPLMPELMQATMAHIDTLLNRFTPLVEVVTDGMFCLDLDGLSLLWPDERVLAAEIGAQLVLELDLRACIGIADTKYAAMLAAREHVRIIPPGADERFLKLQPIDRLPAPPAMIAALRALGVKTLGAFAALPTQSVMMRFGSEARQLQRLARGDDDAHVVAPPPREPIRAAVSFDFGETNRTPLVTSLLRRLGSLYRQMVRAQLVAQALLVGLIVEDGTMVCHTLPLNDELVELRQLRQLLAWHMETVELPGPITEATLEFSDLHPLRGRQLDLFAREQEGDIRRLLDELGSRWGSGSIVQSQLTQSRRVERAFTWETATPPASVPPYTPDEVHAHPALRLLPVPRTIKVVCDNARPVALQIARGWERIETLGGPWRLTEGWWDTRLERDEYQFGTAKGVYLVVHDLARDSWSLLGAFD